MITQPAGLLDQRITIEAKTVARNSIGEETETWATFATVWAMYRPVRVSERLAGAQLQAEFDTVFRIRFLAGIDPEMRVVWRGQRFELVGQPLMVDAASRLLDLFCTAGIRDGR
jgi:SPP1 family predicted phage head-tail adaptor